MIDLKTRIDELTVELEAAQREARAALAELQKMKHLYEKAVEQKEALARENKKLQGQKSVIFNSAIFHNESI